MRRSLAVALLLALVVAATPAAAERNRAPNARLIVGDTVQRGARRTACWGEFCYATSGWSFPEPRRVPAGRQARIRIWSALPLRHVDLDGWRRATISTTHGPEPAGPRIDFKIGVHPVVRDGEVRGRVVTLRLPSPGELWLDLSLRWPNDRFDHRRSASYSFALELA